MASITPGESLLKYGTAMLVTKTTDLKTAKDARRPSKMKPDPPSSALSPVPPPPKPKSASEGAFKENEEILNYIFPPKEWKEGNQLWVLKVSTTPCTRPDVMSLEEQLNTKLQLRQAKETGLCPARRDLYTQCFDELIRQVTINCAERGLLLLRVRNEIQLTMAAYHTLYESSVAFAVRKALKAKRDKTDVEQRILDLENEVKELKQKVKEQKFKCEETERKGKERRYLKENNHRDEIQFLKTAKDDLTTQLEMIVTPKT
ncbi:axonemal dynein light intermediate polypeptide 1 [Neosynchiropus ocellatus]